MSVTIERVRPADTAREFGVQHYRSAAERGITVSQLLERQDPTPEYAGNDPARHLDAFERVMHAAGLISAPIESMGIRASTWEDAMQTQETRALLHEFCARVWRSVSQPAHQTAAMQALVEQGQAGFAEDGKRAILLSGDAGVNTLLFPYADQPDIRAKRLVPSVPLEAIVAKTTPIDRDAYRAVYIVDDLGTDAYRYKRVGEAAEIPGTTLVTGEQTVRIQKFGRLLRATYEQLRRLTLDRIAFIIARMALQAEVDKVGQGITTIVSGDGNANTAATVLTLTSLDAAATAGTLTLKGYLTFRARFGPGYVMDTALANEGIDIQMQLLPVNTVNGIPLAILPQSAFGSIRPIVDYLSGGVRHGITTDAPALKIVGFDSRFALELVTEIGGNVSEVERFVTNQTQVLTLTEVMGFKVLDVNSSRILNVNA